MMNSGIICMLLMLLGISSTGKTRIIEKPLFGARTIDIMEVNKIVLGDAATIFYMDASACGGKLTGVDQQLYLSANGIKYELQEARGVTLPKNMVSSANVDMSHPYFELVFPPIPVSTGTVDLIFKEGGKSLPVAIWDIQTRENRGSKTWKKIPVALRKYKLNKDASWKAPVFKTGRTRLELHLLGYAPKMGEITVSRSGLIPGMDEYTVGEDGIVVAEFDQYVSTEVQVVVGKRIIRVVVDPGEDATLYVDVQIANFRYSSYFRDEYERPVGYYSGNREDLNRRLLARLWTEIPSDELTWEKGESMEPEKYVAFCLEKYNDALQFLENDSSLSDEYRYYSKLEAQLICLNRILYMRANFTKMYQCGIGDERLPRVEKAYFKPLKSFDLTNYDLMLLNSVPFMKMLNSFKTEGEVKEYFGEGYLSDLYKAQVCFPRFGKNLPLKEEQLAVMRTATPEIARLFEKVYSEGNKAWMAHLAKPGYAVREISEKASGEEAFEMILERYKGRVIFIDFWGTSCVPCVKAMKMMKPVKKEFEGQPISYVFITSQNASPLEIWQQMIPNIGGEHYRLTRKQNKYLTDRFNITGVPFYLLVNKKGEVVYETVGFMGCEKMRELIKKEI
ncbi:TlpA disulfide reductase family protein [Butyricimonas hominis]|uniref:TlpA family protein disulfide reductase n=1 Tax=Butyricimonas TaxID=574697 RepID=UPI0035198078